MPADDLREHGGDADAAVPAPHQVSARVEALIERGLERYGAGDLLGALCEWEHALALDPGAERATEYVQYVRDNFAILDEQWRTAKEAAARAAAMGPPCPDVPEEVSGAYDLVELGFAPPTPVPFVPAPASRSASPLDEGWEIDDLAAPLPPPPAAPDAAAPPASSLDDDLAAVSAGLDAMADMAGSELGADPAPAGDVLRAAEEEITVPGGEAPPPLPEQPALSADALAALGGRLPIVTIAPRGEVTNPGELPAPPAVATPSELDLELGSLDAVLPDDRAPAEPALSPEVGTPLTAAVLGLGGEEETGEATSPAGRKQAMALLHDEDLKTGERAVFAAEEMPTIERGGAAAARGVPTPGADEDLFPEMEFSSEFDAATRERSASRPAPALDAEPARGSPAVIVDEALLRAYDDAADPVELEKTTARGALDGLAGMSVLPDDIEPSIELGGELGGALDDAGAGALDDAGAGAPPEPEMEVAPAPEPAEADEDRIRRRVNELLKLAREAAERGDHLSAVEAAEMAAAEDPEGIVAPVVLHRHRDLLYRVYEGHIGEMTQVPLIAVPLHQIAAAKLDHKTGFLLSRIDGMLSFEDILDVAGMPRLDAYRILSTLLRKGFIEVRQA